MPYLWPFIPQRSFQESLTWKTDLLGAKSAEQRIALRAQPRYNWRFDFVLNAEQHSRAKLLARSQYAEDIYIPLWSEFTELGAVSSGAAALVFNTAYAHYKDGGYAMVWESDKLYEVVEITTVAAGQLNLNGTVTNNYTNALVAPVKLGKFAQPLESDRGATNDVETLAYFVSDDSEDLGAAGSYDVYRTHPVMTDRSVLLGTFTERVLQEVQDHDSGIGGVARSKEKSYPITASAISWDFDTKSDLWALRTWLHRCRGSWKGFWVPSWAEDCVVTADISSADNTVSIQDIGFVAHGLPTDIMIQELNGTRHYLQVLGAVAGSPGEEDLVISGTAGFNLAAVNIDFVSFMQFMRFNTDRFEIRHMPASRATITAAIKEVPVP